MYKKAAELLKICSDSNLSIAQVVMNEEIEQGNLSEEEIRQKLWSYFEIMRTAAHKTLHEPIRSLSGLTGGDAKKVFDYVQTDKKKLSSNVMIKAAYYSFSNFEVNTSMGLIVAAPTAGACGILPGVLIAVAEELGSTNDQILDALLVATAVGQLIVENATISGAEGGCQAECGAGSAMAAAAAVCLMGGTSEMCFQAASIVIKCILGLVCDPIAGLVEIPCGKRNGMGVANAIFATDLVLAGLTSFVPFDEVVDAMMRVGRALPHELRETSLGGLATTPTGKRIKKILG